jgi:RimJ/RimL family protein N-acetyltransferase
MPSIEFRRLVQDDLPLVFTWLGRPHVSKWYASAPTSFAEVMAKYGPRTEESSAVQAYIVRVDGADAGYIQTYPIELFADYAERLAAGPDAAGVDLFLGDAWRVGHGVGPTVIRRFVEEIVFGRNAAAVALAGPSEANLASIRAFEKAGFSRWKVVDAGGAEPECVMRMERDLAEYRLAPIDLARDAEVCLAFRRDSYVASFGSDEGVEEEIGRDGEIYLGHLRERIAQVPEGNSHLWRDGRIVGQTEMRLSHDADVGYVNLFYVLPEFRERGLGRRLHGHAVDVFRARGKQRLRLSVSVRNAPAIAFYRALGWRQVGTRPNRELMEILEFPLAQA